MNAFPRPISTYKDRDGYRLTEPAQDGMTLRQWYAGLAMQGLLANVGRLWEHEETKLAERAFVIADIMLDVGAQSNA